MHKTLRKQAKSSTPSSGIPLFSIIGNTAIFAFYKAFCVIELCTELHPNERFWALPYTPYTIKVVRDQVWFRTRIRNDLQKTLPKRTAELIELTGSAPSVSGSNPLRPLTSGRISRASILTEVSPKTRQRI